MDWEAAEVAYCNNGGMHGVVAVHGRACSEGEEVAVDVNVV